MAAGLGLKKKRTMVFSENKIDVSHLSGNVARGVAVQVTAARLVPNVENHLTRNLETR
jgi:hypothetical protein